MDIETELLKPDAYPEPPGDIELVQTHISYVFIGNEFVYKVKKPVDFGFCNFSTMELREFYCNQEVALNKRLSPEIYVGVIPITDDGYSLKLDGDGEVVDYAVKMKKIPMDKLMKTLSADGKLTDDMVRDVAAKIAGFHAEAEVSERINKFGTIRVVKGNTDENFEQTQGYIGQSIDKQQFEDIRNYTNAFYETDGDEFQKRIDQGRVKDCHGDLHMEHICFTDPISIFDCIEFNERFRYSDTAADIAFLAMDLDFNKRTDLSKVLMDAYIQQSGDTDAQKMVDFYKVYRAYVRGKVISFMLDDPHIPEVTKNQARDTARLYFELAQSYVKD
jgi:aminoglycoside phosphotransferase family enzyme